MKIQKLLFESQYNDELRSEIIDSVYSCAENLNIEVNIEGNSVVILSGDYDGALQDLNDAVIEDLGL
jgi:hypothetical protein